MVSQNGIDTRTSLGKHFYPTPNGHPVPLVPVKHFRSTLANAYAVIHMHQIGITNKTHVHSEWSICTCVWVVSLLNESKPLCISLTVHLIHSFLSIKIVLFVCLSTSTFAHTNTRPNNGVPISRPRPLLNVFSRVHSHTRTNRIEWRRTKFSREKFQCENSSLNNQSVFRSFG